MHEYKTISGAVAGTLKDLLSAGERAEARGQPALELRCHSFRVLEPCAEPVVTACQEINLKIAAYTAAERSLHRKQERRASEWARHAKMWASLANPDGTINSAYGWLVFGRRSVGRKGHRMTPWDWARSSLQRDPATRQAFVRVSLPRHQWFGNLDQVCTMHLVFCIRGGALHLEACMRSNDACFGLPYDMPWFCSLIPQMIHDLRMHVPGLEQGTYTHFAHSMHLYERDLERARRMIG